MEYKLSISIQAYADTINAVDYYDSISSELGDRFLIQLYEQYQKIQTNPQYYSYISDNPKDKFRDVILADFPYVVIYEIHQAEIIITAVFNTHRKPFSQ